MYAEGTRYTEAKHKASIEYAKSKNLPIYKHHLLPRIKGFNLLMQSGRNTSMLKMTSEKIKINIFICFSKINI